MKNIFFIAICFIVCSKVTAQTDFYTIDVTPKVYATLVKRVKVSADSFTTACKQRDDVKGESLEFMIDTFKIKKMLQLRLNDYDYSTGAMTTAMDEHTTAYDKLMSQYYKKLLTKLKAEDKKVLIAAQKSWIQFRDNERKLMNTMAKEIYSGGGTIQIMVVYSSYDALVEHRAIQLAEYYLNNYL
jgi:uncharacterized protein YecT (DUF1311 family)